MKTTKLEIIGAMVKEFEALGCEVMPRTPKCILLPDNDKLLGTIHIGENSKDLYKISINNFHTHYSIRGRKKVRDRYMSDYRVEIHVPQDGTLPIEVKNIARFTLIETQNNKSTNDNYLFWKEMTPIMLYPKTMFKGV